ncbi:hypothetical protein Q4577_02615 [Marinovum sp. 2_MG-2023]|uniref:hypothetical protein n=1 Tax=Roseobacteraceae TaxID=2854170 RepID=UPI001FD1150E|nr:MULTISPECIES: hypothetical protein [Roseobacteraceae]MCJ7874642.1 hypothetical protein [Phaeobacter sp. J2-8]MDO6728892.1 hypothetical protein [Marinovum sp. 2_MG-2023]MDO6777692.1 hypothetical protein [Marinovum sp. 1_MG-2023]
MDWLVWGGALVSVVGVVGLIWCITTVMRAKKSALSEEAMRAVMHKVLPRNLAALFLSVIGLMMVILGISFG